MYRFNNGIPNLVTLYGVPTRGESLVKGELGIYAQDRWTIDRWTLNAGVRFDGFRGGYPEQFRGPELVAAGPSEDAAQKLPLHHQETFGVEFFRAGLQPLGDKPVPVQRLWWDGRLGGRGRGGGLGLLPGGDREEIGQQDRPAAVVGVLYSAEHQLQRLLAA